jgi:hypothetical protein
MVSNRETTTDWVNLPEGTVTLSLWDTLHDGDLLEIESDLLSRTVTMRLDVGYVREFHKLPADTRFVITIIGVQSARSLRYVPWPGEFSMPPGATHEQQSKLIADYHRKWREESQAWSDFERMTSEQLEISNAILARAENSVALQLDISVGHKSYIQAFVRGEEIAFHVGDHLLKLEEFVQLGEAYWEAFAQRRLE